MSQYTQITPRPDVFAPLHVDTSLSVLALPANFALPATPLPATPLRTSNTPLRTPVQTPVQTPQRSTKRTCLRDLLTKWTIVQLFVELIKLLMESPNETRKEAFSAMFDTIRKCKMNTQFSEAAASVIPPDSITSSEITNFRRKRMFKLCSSVLFGTSAETLTAAKSFLEDTLPNVLPSRKVVRQFTNKFRLFFLDVWRLKNTETGMRVSLVEAVKWTAKNCHGLESIDGLRVDIWGDGMARGNTEVTRFCFRVLGNQTESFKCQTRDATFCFAVFTGKDSAVNLAKNLGSETRVGDPGWLYEETKTLVNEYNVHLTLSGDSPFMTRIIHGKSNDMAFFSRMMWIPDPPPSQLKAILDEHPLVSKEKLY